jgi:hypothetical protein
MQHTTKCAKGHECSQADFPGGNCILKGHLYPEVAEILLDHVKFNNAPLWYGECFLPKVLTIPWTLRSKNV